MMEEIGAGATLGAEIYQLDTGVWRMVAESRVPRLYHSIALLTPDDKVITAGSNPQRKTEELRIEVYWPPYLIAGARPSCTPAQVEIHYGEALDAMVPDAAGIRDAALMQPGATTHSSELEQRLVDLPITVTAASTLRLQLPGQPTLAPPGWYLLFVVNQAGVPSAGSWVHLS